MKQSRLTEFGKRVLIRAATKTVPTFHVRVGRDVLRVPGTLGVASALTWAPNWKSKLMHRSLLASPGVCLDVGANFGQTLFDYIASPVRPGYVGFEPSAFCFEHLEKIRKLNALEDCAFAPIALSDKNDIAKFFVEMDGDPGATLMDSVRPQ